METVLLEVQNNIATITLNRPDALNSLSEQLRKELTETFTRVNEDDDVRVVVLTGAGRAFCAGMDIKEAAQRGGPRQRPPEETEGRPPGGNTGGAQLGMSVHKPMIAAINGAAAGAGLGLALSCDIIIASENAFITAAFISRGLVEQNTLSLLMKKAPVGWAMWLILSGARVDIQTARQVGIINEVVPAGELMDRAYELAEKIAGNSFIALLAAKEKARQIMESTFNDAMAVDGPIMQQFRTRNESQEGLQAFSEKRTAQFD